MALMKRLNTDRSLAPLVAQFVPLKIDTQTPEWQAWARKYPHEGTAIPILYVVRADGTKMYAQSNALPDDALGPFLLASLREAGRILSASELEAIQKAAETARAAQEQGDTFAAVKALAGLKKIGTPGELGSYAASAIAVDQLAAQLNEQGKLALADAEEKLAGDDPLAGALALVEVKRIYALLPSLKSEVTSAYTQHERDADTKTLLAQAAAFDRAKTLASETRTRRQGIASLERIAAQDANPAIAELARAELAKLQGDPEEPEVKFSVVEVEESAAEPLRTWTDSTGNFKIEAKFVAVEETEVVLAREDGSTLRVPLERLSEADQNYVKGRAAQP